MSSLLIQDYAYEQYQMLMQRQISVNLLLIGRSSFLLFCRVFEDGWKETR